MNELPLLEESDLGTYADYLIREYKRWFLLLHHDQRLIGRCYIWWRVRGGMQELHSLPLADWLELKSVMQTWAAASKMLFGMSKPNYEWLGNAVKSHGGHGHMHCVPRYTGTFTFLGVTGTDENFRMGKPHRTPLPDGRPQPMCILTPRENSALIALYRSKL